MENGLLLFWYQLVVSISVGFFHGRCNSFVCANALFEFGLGAQTSLTSSKAGPSETVAILFMDSCWCGE